MRAGLLCCQSLRSLFGFLLELWTAVSTVQNYIAVMHLLHSSAHIAVGCSTAHILRPAVLFPLSDMLLFASPVQSPGHLNEKGYYDFKL